MSPEIIRKAQKTYSFLIMSGGIEVNKFIKICLILEAEFEENPYRTRAFRTLSNIYNGSFLRN